jgi:antitoxin Phd
MFMQTKQWSLQDAKNKFSAVIDAAQKGKAQVVTRRGIPTAVVLSIEEFEKFQRFEAAQLPSFIDHLLSMPTDDSVFERINVQLRDFK